MPPRNRSEHAGQPQLHSTPRTLRQQAMRHRLLWCNHIRLPHWCHRSSHKALFIRRRRAAVFGTHHKGRSAPAGGQGFENAFDRRQARAQTQRYIQKTPPRAHNGRKPHDVGAHRSPQHTDARRRGGVLVPPGRASSKDPASGIRLLVRSAALFSVTRGKLPRPRRTAVASAHTRQSPAVARSPDSHARAVLR